MYETSLCNLFPTSSVHVVKNRAGYDIVLIKSGLAILAAYMIFMMTLAALVRKDLYSSSHPNDIIGCRKCKRSCV